MKKNTVLYLLIIVLIAINGFFLFNYLERPQHKGPKESGSFIAKELNLNEAQLKQFNALEEKHHTVMQTFGEDIKLEKEALFNKITKPKISQKILDSLINSITNKEILIEKELFNRLRGLYELCNEEQKERFNEIIKKARKFDGKGPQRPRNRE